MLLYDQRRRLCSRTLSTDQILYPTSGRISPYHKQDMHEIQETNIKLENVIDILWVCRRLVLAIGVEQSS